MFLTVTTEIETDRDGEAYMKYTFAAHQANGIKIQNYASLMN